VTLPGTGGTLAFKYDGLGRRVEKAFTQGSTTTTTVYLYDGNNAVADLDQNGNVLARYTATRNIDEPLAELRSSVTSFYEQDGLNSVTSLTTSAGALANTYTYDSFGKLVASTGSIANRFQYTGREFDPETGIYFYRARYYDPTNAGRFLNEDPLYSSGSIRLRPVIKKATLPVYFYYLAHSNRPTARRFGVGDPLGLRGGINKYTYALQNPANDTDPFGLWTAGFGVTINVQWGVVNIEGSYGVVVDGFGNIGLYGSAGAGVGVGASAAAGASIQWSPTAHTICDLGGPFQYGSASAGAGIDGTVDEFTGFNSDGSPIIGGGLTVGAGVGGGANGGINYTTVTPIGSL